VSILRNRYYAVKNLIPARAQKTRKIVVRLHVGWYGRIISFQLELLCETGNLTARELTIQFTIIGLIIFSGRCFF